MQQTVDLLMQYKYLVLLPLSAVEGPIVSLIVGFLIFGGYLSVFPSLCILILGDLIPDSIYYYIGRFGDKKDRVKKYAVKSKIISRMYPIIERLWRDHPIKTMFFSKLAYGFSIPFLITAGLARMPLRQFVTLSVPVSIFQYGIIMLVGYLLGHSYQIAAQYVQYAGFIVAGIFIVFLMGYVFFIKYARVKIAELEIEEEQKAQGEPEA